MMEAAIGQKPTRLAGVAGAWRVMRPPRAPWQVQIRACERFDQCWSGHTLSRLLLAGEWLARCGYFTLGPDPQLAISR